MWIVASGEVGLAFHQRGDEGDLHTTSMFEMGHERLG